VSALSERVICESRQRRTQTYRVEERRRVDGEVEVLAAGQRSLTGIMAVFRCVMTSDPARYRASDGPYQLLVVGDGVWTPETVSSVSPRAIQATTLRFLDKRRSRATE